ncbi:MULTISPECIES: urease accessory UreF family protein [unclassified Chelatococcus]|uniref:urease accessory protein UreF n=1 Tax=unclassified Chelatococcus TaxID=2638111 RepID=UPI001BCB2FC6|nr:MULTISPECIES: urease accessory UreF family protein [unclassified Chelatococcus]CAH1672273.1 Urease accessory protein UreF 2 [Hyphomicrobiales bacterium]MBS7738968.1 urease accessory protein UreF [Chelatococcus sp. HY11]MBX3543401.1 urease accessory protein UreF [Chelatococcus sp.]MCO5076502.1 urease accessory protein UreF [Chelatococcus sp.]CAH1675499.1 Urease accessory protein UreF 2 [Hyphomicrobiales bacterium]
MEAASRLPAEQQTIPLHLLRLVSQGLPVGGFSYSRGLEAAVQAGWVSDEATARDWILGTLQANVAQLDGALFWRMATALGAGDAEGFRAADAWLAAGRESLEFQREDRRLGEALLRLLADLDVPAATDLQGQGLTYPAAFALAAHHWRIAPLQALSGLLWVYVEGQVTAAIRLVPLGHTAGQRILVEAVGAIGQAADRARLIDDRDVGNLSPALAMASAWHETQYSRLFQS